MRQIKASGKEKYDFDEPSYRGIMATSSNPASEKILETLGFQRDPKMEMARFGIEKWIFVPEFSNKK